MNHVYSQVELGETRPLDWGIGCYDRRACYARLVLVKVVQISCFNSPRMAASIHPVRLLHIGSTGRDNGYEKEIFLYKFDLCDDC
jgi:hypothetical protein